ncbi:hypothetical protein BKA83DRAFT_326887 [Pisolithus microcarpus]|nr:hypothetical protein BKA83DRAFT_326887 [Pisolithus microcarpus]
MSPSRQVGDLLKDWRKVNISSTRAQSKLIIIGSRNFELHNSGTGCLRCKKVHKTCTLLCSYVRNYCYSHHQKSGGERRCYMIENFTVPKKPRTTAAGEWYIERSIYLERRIM